MEFIPSRVTDSLFFSRVGRQTAASPFLLIPTVLL